MFFYDLEIGVLPCIVSYGIQTREDLDVKNYNAFSECCTLSEGERVRVMSELKYISESINLR